MNKLKFLMLVFIVFCLFGVMNVNAEVISIKGNSVWRSDVATASIRFISNITGTVYYKITECSEVPTIIDIMTNGIDGGSVTANITKSITLTDLTSGAKYIHIVVQNGDNLSNVLTISMPYDLYYFDNFEAYNLDSYPPNFTIKYNGLNNNSQKIINATQKNNTLGNVFQLIGTSGWASDQRISINANNVNNYIYFEADTYFANSNASALGIGLGNDTDSRIGTWTGSLTRISLENNKVRYRIADTLYDVKALTIEKLHWYNIKIILDT